MKSERQLSEELIKIILASSDYFVGIARGVKADGTVNVAHPQGYSVSAIAATPMTSSRTVTAFRVGSQWYAFGEINTVVNESVLLLRKSKPRGSKKYPVKTIFGIRDNFTFIYLGYYLGGDRRSKLLSNQIPDETELGNLQLTNYGKNKFSVYGNYFNSNMFVVVNDKIIRQTANIQPNYFYFNTEYSGNKIITSETIDVNFLTKQGVINNQIVDYEYSRLETRPLVTFDELGYIPYGWSYFGSFNFPDEYEYDMKITSYLEETPTALTLTSSHFLETTTVSNASTVRAILGDDLIWRTGFFLDGAPTVETIITDKEATFTISGNSTVIYTNDGYINQEYEGSITFKEGYKQRYLTTSNRYYWALDDAYFVPQEIKNIISLHYGNTEIVLNTNDFFVTLLNYFFYEKPEVGDTFNFLFHNIGGKQASGVDINLDIFQNNNYLANIYYYDSETDKETYFLIKGELLGAISTVDPDIYSVSCNIAYVKEELTSFADHLILDNGSFYNFLLRNSDGLELPKININNRNYQSAYYQGKFLILSEGWTTPYTETTTNYNIPFLFLDQNYVNLLLSTYYTNRYGRWLGKIPFTDYLEMFFGSFGKGFFDVIGRLGLKNVNIIKNKIYCVTKTDRDKAWIEQWDILDNGDVKYNKVFQVDYVPLKKPNADNNERLVVFAHSYYPIK